MPKVISGQQVAALIPDGASLCVGASCAARSSQCTVLSPSPSAAQQRAIYRIDAARSALQIAEGMARCCIKVSIARPHCRRK